MSIELLKWLTGIDLVHIPYKGASPALVDVIGGQVQLMCTSPLAAMPHVKSGKLRALATTGYGGLRPRRHSDRRRDSARLQSALWYALLAPAGTPQPIVQPLHAETVKIVKRPRGVSRSSFERRGPKPWEAVPRRLEKFMRSEIAQWAADESHSARLDAHRLTTRMRIE